MPSIRMNSWGDQLDLFRTNQIIRNLTYPKDQRRAHYHSLTEKSITSQCYSIVFLNNFIYQQFRTHHMIKMRKNHLIYLTTVLLLIHISYTIVSPFDYSTTMLTMQSKTPTLFLLTSQSLQKSNSKSNHLYQFHQAALLYYTLYPNKSPENTEVPSERVLFVVSDPNDGLYTFDRLAQFLGVEKKDTPTVIFLSHTHEKYRMKKQVEITGESIVRFLQDINSGKQPIFYKSQSVDSIQNNKNKYVKKLVGSNFNQVILSSEKECMVIFYAPLDYKSRVVKLQFDKTAQSLRNNKNIQFYKVDSTKNEVLIQNSPENQLLIKQSDTPMILFFTKDKQKPCIKYSTLKQYEQSSDYMIKWLKQTTEFNWVRSADVSEDFFEEL